MLESGKIDFGALILISSLLLVAITDFRSSKIPNLITLPLMLLGFVAALFGWNNGVTPIPALVGAVVGLLLFLGPFLAGWLGGGDVKLLAAYGAWLGMVGIVWTAIAAVMLGAMAGSIQLILKGRFVDFLRRAGVWMSYLVRHRKDISSEVLDRSHRLPFGPAISCAAILTYLFPEWPRFFGL